MKMTLQDIEEQVSITQKRGEKIVQYLNKYEGQSIYNEIALAIEFGYQIKQEEDDEAEKKVFQKSFKIKKNNGNQKLLTDN